MASSRGMRSASQQQSGWPAGQEDGETRRPSTLTAMVLVSGLGAFCAFISAVITFVDGRSLLSSSLGLGTGAVADAAVDAADSTLKSRAIIALVAFVIVAVLIIAARSGRMRVGLTIMLPLAAAAWVINVVDSGVPGLLRGLDGVAVLLAVISLFLVWLPANNRYARERKALRKGR